MKEYHVSGKGHPADYVAKTCFGAAYIFTLLSDGFHIGLHDRRFIFSNNVMGPFNEPFEAKWVLGALLVDVMHAAMASNHREQPGGLEVGPGSPPPIPQWGQAGVISVSHRAGMDHPSPRSGLMNTGNIVFIIALASGLTILTCWSKLMNVFDTTVDGGA